MPFTSETGAEAGKLSKRNASKIGAELKNTLQDLSLNILKDLDYHTLSNRDKIQLLKIATSFVLPKQKAIQVTEEIQQTEYTIEIIDKGEQDDFVTLSPKIIEK